MLFFKNKFDKLTREDIVDAICKLENESSIIEEEIVSSQSRIDALIAKGKKETSSDIKLLYAKKINAMKAERAQNIQRAEFLLYNTNLLNKLKMTVDDNQFFAKTSKMALGKLLGDQRGLAKFLNKALNNRISAENVLTEADETFKEIEESYEKNEEIYGIQKNDDELLALFETDEMMTTEQKMAENATSIDSQTTEE